MAIGVYSGSKAAVSMITKTLRQELARFGVKFVTVVTSGVKTNNFTNGLNFKLPPIFQYLSIEKIKGYKGVPVGKNLERDIYPPSFHFATTRAPLTLPLPCQSPLHASVSQKPRFQTKTTTTHRPMPHQTPVPTNSPPKKRNKD